MKNYDVIVYGATPGGIAAACSAAELGASVLVAEPTGQVGGHWSSGICTTEYEHMLPVTFGGWMLRFLTEVGRRYGIAAPLHRWEPHVVEETFQAVLDESGVEVRCSFRLTAAEVVSGKIRSIADDEGNRLCGRYYIDGSYGGDLMAAAGVPYAVGREGRDRYGESLAGVRFVDSVDEVRNSKGHALLYDQVWPVDLRNGRGGLIEGVASADAERLRRGAGDGRVMNYHFRVTVTKGAERIPFPRPENYREERFELFARYLKTYPETPYRKIIGFIDNPSGLYAPSRDGFPGYSEVVPGDKWELNNVQASVLSLGYLGGQFAYPEGDWRTRDAVVRDHYEYNAGLLYFLSSSPEIPAAVREEGRRWGLPPDEYRANGHWPYQPYIRETRRMLGRYVLTQKDLLQDRGKEDAVLMNSHWIDCHHVERLALDEGSFRNEGRIWKELTRPYCVPYRALLPPEDCVSNLLVSGCVSASHVAFCSIRVESSWMGLGEAAGCAAVQALSRDVGYDGVDVQALQETLRGRGVALYPSGT